MSEHIGIDPQSKEFSAPNDGEERDDSEESILRVATQAKQDV